MYSEEHVMLLTVRRTLCFMTHRGWWIPAPVEAQICSQDMLPPACLPSQDSKQHLVGKGAALQFGRF